MKTMKRPAYNALQNLIIAERVCNYVGQKMTKGSPIKPIDMEHSRMRNEPWRRDFKLYYNQLPCYRKQRMAWQWRPKPDLHESMLWLQRYKIEKYRSSGPFLWVIRNALVAEQSGIGNCFEQAAVGFRYLCEYTNCKVFTLVEVGLDHSFLVIGVDKDKLKGVYRLNKAPDWPANAVICDPWYNEWFIVKKHWCIKMRAILKAAEQEEPVKERSLTTGVIRFQNPVQGPEPPVNIE